MIFLARKVGVVFVCIRWMQGHTRTNGKGGFWGMASGGGLRQGERGLLGMRQASPAVPVRHSGREVEREQRNSALSVCSEHARG